MNPEEIFREHPKKREELANILSLPVMREALDAIGDKAKARNIPEPRMNAHLDTLMSQQYLKCVGIQYALDSFERLTKPNLDVSDGNDDEDPFFHALPEHMREAIKKKRNQDQ